MAMFSSYLSLPEGIWSAMVLFQEPLGFNDVHAFIWVLHGTGFNIWLVVWNMNFIFPYIGNNNPNWRTHIFQRGRYTTNQTCFNPPDSAWLSWTGKNGKNGKGTVLNCKWHSRSDPTPRRASWHATENLEGTNHLNAVCANHETILTAFRSWILCLKHIRSIVTTEKDRKVISYYNSIYYYIVIIYYYYTIIIYY